MIHCLSCEKYPTDEKVIPYGSTFPIDTFKVKLISKDSLNEMPTDGTDVVELPDNIKFSVGSKLYIVNGDDGSEVYIYGANGFEAYTACEVITGSNSIMNFETDYEAPLKSLKIDISPIQDLHGYDNPWPAGGGKNLFPGGKDATSNGGTLVNNGDGTITITASANASACLFYALTDVFLPKNTYVTISLNNSDVNGYVGARFMATPPYSETTIYGTYVLADTQNARLTTYNGFDANAFNIFVRTNHPDVSPITLKIQIELGREQTEWSPYSNICPISGWTGAMVSRTGKNLVDVDPFTLIMDTSRTKSININPLPVGTYTVSVNVTKNTATKTTSLSIRDKSSAGYVVIDNFSISAGVTGIVTKTITANIPFAYIYAYESSTETSGAEVTIKDIQIELGSTATAYEPYAGNTYPISWETEAGTAYGGTLDVVSGELVVDRANIASYDGETLPSAWISDRDVYASGSTPTTGAQVVYELATPHTYQLTPTEVRTLLGRNNVWADTGNVTEIKYLKMK